MSEEVFWIALVIGLILIAYITASDKIPSTNTRTFKDAFEAYGAFDKDKEKE